MDNPTAASKYKSITKNTASDIEGLEVLESRNALKCADLEEAHLEKFRGTRTWIEECFGEEDIQNV